MPYSVSIPRTFATDIVLQVLAGTDVLNRTTAEDVGLFAVDERADEDDPFALLSRHACPVVRVRGIREVFVLAVLLSNGFDQVFGAQATTLVGDLSLHGELLRSTNDVLDHRAAREVLEVQHLFIATLVGDLEEPILVVHSVHVGDGVFDHHLDSLGAVSPAEVANRTFVDRKIAVEVPLEDLRRCFGVGSLDLDFHVETSRAKDRRVDQVLAVGRADDDDIAQRFDPVDLGQELRDDRGFHVRTNAGPSGAKKRIHLVEEDDDGHAFFGLFSSALEDHPDLAFGLADVFVEKFRPFDVEEVGPHVAVAGEFGNFLRERVRDRFGDQCLATSRRAVEQDALGRRQVVVVEERSVQIRQLYGVGDGLDLGVESADVGVGDVRDLFENELFGFLAEQLLDQQIRSHVQEQGVTAAQFHVPQRVREVHHSLFVGAPVDEDSAFVEHLFHGDDFSLAVGLAHADHGEGLIQHDLVASVDLARVECRVQGHSHLSAGGEDVDGAVVVEVDEGAVDRGWLGQLFDFVTQGRDLITCLLDGDGELLVV